jgi:phage host-nuclease inhibitor protein Gam
MTRIKKSLIEITRDDASRLVHEIAELTVEERDQKNEMDAAILAIREKYSARLNEIKSEVSEKTSLVQAWAQANPEAFGKLRSIQFECGRVGYRTGTPKLKLLNRKWTWESCLAAVQKILPAFIRNKPEIDKEAIINQREELAEYLPLVGMKIEQDETFFIEPDLSKFGTRTAA